jgi:ribonuclease HI
MIELENHKWTIEFNWIKVHAGHQGNELADQLVKEAATSNDINECYSRIPESTVKSELGESSVEKWQTEWGLYDKSCNYKIIFS